MAANLYDRQLKHNSPGVFINGSEAAFALDQEHIDLLIKEISHSPKRRARICVHKSNEDIIHQMLIAMSKNHYVQPHKHRDKVESYQVVKGEALFIHFSEDGRIESINKLSPKNYFLRPKDQTFHSLHILSDFFVFMETTNGPFNEDSTIPPEWAPAENDYEKVKLYQSKLLSQISEFDLSR